MPQSAKSEFPAGRPAPISQGMRTRRHPSLASLALLAALALAGCAKPTPYQPVADGYGYESQRLERDRFRISFSGNAMTPRATVENYLLYRAAELRLEQGGGHFVVLYREMERHGGCRNSGRVFYPSFGVGSCWGCGWSSGVGTGIVVGTGERQERYQAYAEVAVRPGPPPSDNPHAYDAGAIIERLGPTVVREPAGAE